MGVISDAVTWSGSGATLSLFVVTRGPPSFDPAAVSLAPAPQRTKAFELEDETDALPGRSVFVYDFVYSELPSDLDGILVACLNAAWASGAEVAWFAFEGSFHFENLLTASIAKQVYAVVDSEGLSIASDETLLSPEWAAHVVSIRERAWGRAPDRTAE